MNPVWQMSAMRPSMMLLVSTTTGRSAEALLLTGAVSRGSRGQRIYVHPRTGIVIVQLANESAQDFPFRKIVHHIAGEPYRYPVGIPGRLFVAARGGASADSLRRLYAVLVERARANPADYVLGEAPMLAVGQKLLERPATRPAGLAVLELAVERSPRSLEAHEALRRAGVSRFDPATTAKTSGDRLQNRMRAEVLLRFEKAA